MTIFAALIIALLVSLLFAPSYRQKGTSFAPLILFFFILFFGGIAASFWIIPFGPIYWGVSWFPILFIVLIFTFLFSAPSPHQKNVAKTNDKAEESAVIAASISMFVWLILLFLLIAILFAYFK